MAADPPLNAIEEIAAAWMVERDRGLSPARQRELDRWLAADARHAAVFEALAETWALIGEARAEVRRDEGIPVLPETRRRFTWLAPVLATAAAIAIVAAGVWRGAEMEQERATSPYALAASTDVGVLRKLELPDGSIIQLNTDSVVDVRYSEHERRVRLARGEAYFTVAKNAARPFIVSAAGVDVRVVGTVFNVRLRSESVDVLVTEGKVRVGAPVAGATSASPPEPEINPLSELTAGQKVSIALAATAVEPAPVPPIVASTAEIRQTLAWQARRLDFDGTPLADIVAEINRYNRHKLVVTDERLNAQRFGGSFPSSDYETFVRMLEADFGVRAERHGNETRLRLK